MSTREAVSSNRYLKNKWASAISSEEATALEAQVVANERKMHKAAEEAESADKAKNKMQAQIRTNQGVLGKLRAAWVNYTSGPGEPARENPKVGNLLD